MSGIYKEEYFTPEKIDRQGQKFLKEISQIRKVHKFKISADKACLLILDMQEFFFNSVSHAFIPSAQAINGRIKKLQDYFLSLNIPVIQTKHINDKKNANQMGRWWRDILQRENKLSELINDVIDERTIVIEKSQYNAFFNTTLEQLLKKRGITQIIIGGVMTHLCCETTAREAFVRGYDVIFGIDFTATYNRRFHSSTLINLSHGFAYPALFDEIKEMVSENEI